MVILSEEQENIYNNVSQGHNVVVDAVAGTGKTTLILSIAGRLPNKKILQITYNKSLRHEVMKRAIDMELENIKIHTFHSLAVKYYSREAHTDIELRKIINNKIKPSSRIDELDLLVLDECQDMTFLYFQLIVKFIMDMGHKIQLLILGDYMQGLYEFKGSDVRFLKLGDSIWEKLPNLRTNEFSKCTMKMSYRITNQMCSFINNALLGENRMAACRDGENVSYIRNSIYNLIKIVYAEILKLFSQGVTPGDIFIIGASVKGDRSAIGKLENLLVERDIPCYVPMMEDEKLDERVSNGKIVFSTFHSVKGRERKYVFVVGFDNSYFKYYARNIPRTVCPPTIFVGTTRAKNGLYLLESDSRAEDRPFDFLKMSHVEMKKTNYIQFKGIHKGEHNPNSYIDDEIDTSLVKKITPTELIKFIPEDILSVFNEMFENIFITEREATEESTIEIPSIIETKKGFYEEVSDITGIAIPCMYYDMLIQIWTGSQSIELENSILNEMIKIQMSDLNSIKYSFVNGIINELPRTITSISDYLYLSNIVSSLQENLFFKIKQIEKEEHNWVSDEIAYECKERLRNTVGVDCQKIPPKIEDYITIASNDEQHKIIDEVLKQYNISEKLFRFTARADIITENVFWELKCVNKITLEHMLQLVIYAWLYKLRSDKDGYPLADDDENEKIFKLFNIKTGEIKRLNATIDELTYIVVELLKVKYKTCIPKTDEEFLYECNAYIAKYE